MRKSDEIQIFRNILQRVPLTDNNDARVDFFFFNIYGESFIEFVDKNSSWS